MKSFIFICLFSLLYLPPTQAQTSCKALEGVWQYDLPDARGMWFSQNNRYSWVLVPKERKAFTSGQPTPEEKALAFDGLNFSTGSFACNGTRVTVTHLYTKDPQQAGKTFQFDYELKDGRCRYWIIQADGSRGAEGSSVKMDDFMPQGLKGCHQLNGFWEFDLPDMYGIFAQSHGYFSWILVDKKYWDAKTNPGTTEAKAQAYDKMIVDAGIVTCTDQGRFTWNQLYTKNPMAENTFGKTDNVFDKDQTQWWNLDQAGKRMETGGKARRLN